MLEPEFEPKSEFDCDGKAFTEAEPAALFVGLAVESREAEAVKPKGFPVASVARVLPMPFM